MITEDIHMYIYYNKYKMDIHIRVYTIYTIGTGVWDNLENETFIYISYKFTYFFPNFVSEKNS